MIWLALILFTAVTVFWIAYDYRFWLKHKAINHNNRFWLRCFTLFPSVVFFWLEMDKPWWWGAFCGAMVGFGFMAIFDTALNILRGLPWNYTGSEDYEQDGTIENLLQKAPWLQYVKVGVFVSLVVIYIVNL